MKLILLVTLLFTSLIMNAQEKKYVTLDLKPDFNDEMKHQERTAKDNLMLNTNNQTEPKSIFDNPKRPKHQFTMGVAAGNTVIQDGIQPITVKPLKAKMNTIYEK